MFLLYLIPVSTPIAQRLFFFRFPGIICVDQFFFHIQNAVASGITLAKSEI